MGFESSSPFLRDSWERVAQHERGEDPLDKALKVYAKIERVAREHPEFQDSKDALDKAVLDYILSVNTLTKHWEEGIIDRDEAQRADHRRRFAHEALISTLNAFSRNLHKGELDNEWLKDVVQNRNSVARWAREIAPFIEGQRVSEEEGEVHVI